MRNALALLSLTKAGFRDIFQNDGQDGGSGLQMACEWALQPLWGCRTRERRGEGRIVYPTEVKIEEIGLMMVGEKKAER